MRREKPFKKTTDLLDERALFVDGLDLLDRDVLSCFVFWFRVFFVRSGRKKKEKESGKKGDGGRK